MIIIICVSSSLSVHRDDNRAIPMLDYDDEEEEEETE